MSVQITPAGDLERVGSWDVTAAVAFVVLKQKSSKPKVEGVLCGYDSDRKCDSDHCAKEGYLDGDELMGVLEYLLVPALCLLCGAPPRWCSNYFPKKLHCLGGTRRGWAETINGRKGEFMQLHIMTTCSEMKVNTRCAGGDSRLLAFRKPDETLGGQNAFNNGSTWEHANLLSSLNCRQTAIATKEKLNYRRWVICNCGSFLCTVTVLSWAKCAGMCLPVALIPCKWKVSCCSCLGWQRASKRHSWRLSTTSHASKRMHWNDSPAPCTLNNKQASSWSL